MATVEVDGTTLRVRLTASEKIAGLLRDVTVPVAQVVGADVVEDGLGAARGLRAPGLGLPGARKVGTWRTRSGRRLVAVDARTPALRVDLAGSPWAGLVVSTPDAAELATRLRAAVAR